MAENIAEIIQRLLICHRLDELVFTHGKQACCIATIQDAYILLVCLREMKYEAPKSI